jgi:hypothetical protein
LEGNRLSNKLAETAKPIAVLIDGENMQRREIVGELISRLGDYGAVGFW